MLQSVKTRVIKNNLNPVWNEKLMLSIPDTIPPLKVVKLIALKVLNTMLFYVSFRENTETVTCSEAKIYGCEMTVQLVYDKDTFTTDDFMGEAEIDIQPLVVAARASESSSTHNEAPQPGKPTQSEATQPGKWKTVKENTLHVKDGVIQLSEGKVKQEIAIKLQNVERGVLEIELECVPLTQ